MDHVGPIARCAADAGAILAAIAGHDGNDPTWNSDGIDAHVQAALEETLDVFKALGMRIVEISAPDVRQSVRDWTPLCAVEAAVAHEATFPAREPEYGPVLASLLRAGRQVSGLDYQRIALRRLALRGGGIRLPVQNHRSAPHAGASVRHAYPQRYPDARRAARART
jgi:amidase